MMSFAVSLCFLYNAGSMKYAIRFEHDALHFSASHFITFDTPEKVEALHGHNFRIKAEIAGPLNSREYVVDFLIAFDALKKICGMLSHKVLLPRDHPYITIDTADDTVHVSMPPLQWVFPAGDTITLPVRNTTTEALAGYIAGLFREMLEQESAFEMPPPQYGITIELEESPGMWAVDRDK
jgi:6-pyruvoyltetrahydropterin/6-carboxytetrahydropterin synthase